MILLSISRKGEHWQFVLLVVKLLTHLSHCREFMNRTERYERGLSMTNRIFELEIIHGWSELETRTAFAALDEQLPIGLHNVGKSSTQHPF